MRIFIKQNWPLIVSILVFLIYSAYYVISIMNRNQGHFIYYYDDSYIHMAMAKSFAQYGVWGVTKYAFTSCSSSLLWTALLAFVYLITGPNEAAPYIICILSSILLITAFSVIYRKEGIKNIFIFLSILLLIYLIYLPSLAVSGLEHITHALITVLFFYYAAEVVSGFKKSTKDIIILILLSVSLPLLRYEGLVSVLLLSVLFLVQKKILLSVYVFLAGTVPIFIFGLISISKGWPPFPISTIMKLRLVGNQTSWDFVQAFSFILSKSLTFVNIVSLIAAAAIFLAGIYYYRKHKEEIPQIFMRDLMLLLIFMVNAVMYFIFSRVNFTARYQAFLIAAAVFVFPIIFFRKARGTEEANKKSIRAVLIGCGVLVLIAISFFYDFRSHILLANTEQMSANIYEQQYQTAHFVNRFYRNEEIAINDVGAICYFNDIKMTDLYGMADYEVLEMKRKGYSADDFKYLAKTRNIKIAIIYSSWFIVDGVSIIPQEWEKVGEWKIYNNHVCGSDVVSFYAVGNGEKDKLIKNLKNNSQYLPPGVTESGIYKETGD